jgi:hypothetical protein
MITRIELDLHVNHRRLSVFSDFANEATNTYAVHKLPQNVEWGARRLDVDMTDKLCPTSRNEPVMLWAVGKLSQLYFRDRSGAPLGHVAIHIKPFNDEYLNKARRILRKWSRPQQRKRNLLCATKLTLLQH